ncbi:MAG: hypothetical protein GY810_11885 [Aureispira sp.]|nr:hypothetical protein [Aureispira sp.]
MNRFFLGLVIVVGCFVAFFLLTKEYAELPSESTQEKEQNTIAIDTGKGNYSHPKVPYEITQPSLNKLYQCNINSNKKIYVSEDKIILNVEIKNNSTQNVSFIRSIDGSDTKIKLPFCLFVIQKENQKPQFYGFMGCGNVLSLQPSDFIDIGINESFSPFVEESTFSAFGEIIGNKIALHRSFFDSVGKYKIQFIYTTESDNINDFLGYHLESYSLEDLENLEKELEKVPRVQLYSNILEIELK